jgi:hypothetical protein
MRDACGQDVCLQTRVLDRWPDGSIRWLLLDWLATVEESTVYRVTVPPRSGRAEPSSSALRAIEASDGVTIDTGRARFYVQRGSTFPFSAVRVDGRETINVPHSGLSVEDEAGERYRFQIDSVAVEEPGPIRCAVRLLGRLVSDGAEPLGEGVARLHFFAHSATVRFVLTIRNPRRAGHPGGLWDLGDAGSVYLRDASQTFALPASGPPAAVWCSPELDAPGERFDALFEIYQDSSGGDRWRSSTHLNRYHDVATTFCGYRVRSGWHEWAGRRATPTVYIEAGGCVLGIAMPHFWQNFPKAIEASAHRLTLRLFPLQSADVHELQGGEQRTHVFFVAFARDQVTDEPLAWCRAPLLPHASAAWYCGSEAVPYLIPKAADPNGEYVRLVDAAIEGPDTLVHKREVSDEYGWRHFGEIYADHEAVFHDGPVPLVSHYNNQYDALAGFACQFLRSADARWWVWMCELAAHVIDIDIYHTDADKAAYNRGLFWHTSHYIDAGTGTHRAYPRGANLAGGGPSDEHNYTTGLMLHHFLTGDPLSRETAVDLARWVVKMDDGRSTVFRWLACSATGLASASGSPSYHGPGRGAGNSVNALIDGHRLSGDPALLAKAEQLIRRCIHPADDIESHHLLDAERRWFYTVFLQALGKYLDYKADCGALDGMYAYSHASLLHYARWMAVHEYPYLDQPEILEFPTETWAAQDMRKSEVFKYAAKHASGAERARFLERANFFFRYATATLTGMATRTLTRPVVLMLNYGFMHAYFQHHPDVSAPAPAVEPSDFGTPQLFVPQKVRAMWRAAALAGAGGLTAAAGCAYLLM